MTRLRPAQRLVTFAGLLTTVSLGTLAAAAPAPAAATWTPLQP